MHPVLVQAAKMGRSGDVHLSHTSPGDVVFPVERRTPEIDAKLKELFALANLKRQRFTVGNRHNKKNPSTGLPEFFDADFATGGGQFDGASGIADSGVAGSVGTDNADSRLDNSQELVSDSVVEQDSGAPQQALAASDADGSRNTVSGRPGSSAAARGGPANLSDPINGGILDLSLGDEGGSASSNAAPATSLGMMGRLGADIELGGRNLINSPTGVAGPLASTAANAFVAGVPVVGQVNSLFGLANALASLAGIDLGLPTAGRLASAGLDKAVAAASNDTTTTDDGAPTVTATMAQSPDIDNDGGGNGAFGGDSLTLPQNLGGTPAIGQTIGRPVATPVSAPSAAASAPESNFGTGIDDIVRRANLA